MHWIIVFVGALVSTSSCIAAQLLHDDFSVAQINPATWSLSAPFGVYPTQESGRAVLVARAGLNTINDTPASIEVKGRFRFAGTEDHFGITLRSDLSYYQLYG